MLIQRELIHGNQPAFKALQVIAVKSIGGSDLRANLVQSTGKHPAVLRDQVCICPLIIPFLKFTAI